MEEQTEAPVEATVTINPDDLTDEQVDQYFETKGESLEAPEKEEEKEVIESQTDVEDRSSVQKPNPQDNRTVPLAALHQERQRRQAQDRQLQVLAQRLETLQQAVTPKEPEIDVNENPIEYFQKENEKLKQQVEQINQHTAQQQQAAMQQAQLAKRDQSVEKFKQVYANAAQEFTKSQTDFPDAYKHLVDSRMQELQALGFTQAQAAKAAERDEAQVVIKAFNDGVNPAERIYNLAKMRGYNQQPQEKQVDLETIEKGVKQKSVGSLKGSPPSQLTLQALADMSDDDFDKAVKDGTFDKLVRQT